MNTSAHDFVTVDMRGLKAALVARAQAERVSVSVRGSTCGRARAGARRCDRVRPRLPTVPRSSRARSVKLSIRIDTCRGRAARCRRATGRPVARRVPRGPAGRRSVADGRLGEPPGLPGRAHRIECRALDAEPEPPSPDDPAAPRRGARGAGVPARCSTRSATTCARTWRSPRARWPSCGRARRRRRAAAPHNRATRRRATCPNPMTSTAC